MHNVEWAPVCVRCATGGLRTCKVGHPTCDTLIVVTVSFLELLVQILAHLDILEHTC